MSRTKKGSKKRDHEYWSRRPEAPGAPGRASKTHTHRIERRQAKDEVHKLQKAGE